MTATRIARPAQVLATDGRVIGSRAGQTRTRLLDATAKLLSDSGVLELKVVDITRAAGTSPATFYQYFADVSEAILTLAELADHDQAPLLDYFAATWRGDAGRASAAKFAAAYVEYWEAHQAVLRARILQADEGDMRFRESRSKSSQRLIEAMTNQLSAGPQAGKLDGYATGGAMLAMLDRLSTFQAEFAKRGVQRERMIDTMAGILFQTLTGESW